MNTASVTTAAATGSNEVKGATATDDASEVNVDTDVVVKDECGASVSVEAEDKMDVVSPDDSTTTSSTTSGAKESKMDPSSTTASSTLTTTSFTASADNNDNDDAVPIVAVAAVDVDESTLPQRLLSSKEFNTTMTFLLQFVKKDK
jgi:hypothetical protein